MILSRYAVATLLTVASPALAIDAAEVSRSGSTLNINWASATPVDIYLADGPDAPLESARLISKRDDDGKFVLADAGTTRRYFVLHDVKSGKLVRVAEREVPLERGSNFRDLGGYAAASGKTVRWGKIFRSGAMPMVTEADYKQLEALKIGSIIDLRSIEERQIAPTGLDDRTGALFLSNDYSIAPLMRDFTNPQKSSQPIYVGLEKLIRPQLKQVFARLLTDEGATLVNCSAGQDRTGVTSALILTALGVDRATILKDYHLSTALRRPANEFPPVNPADYPGNAIVAYYAAAAKKPGGAKAEPLYAANGESLLVQLFAHFDRTYGSTEAYMAKELGIGPVQLTRLRAEYTE